MSQIGRKLPREHAAIMSCKSFGNYFDESENSLYMCVAKNLMPIDHPLFWGLSFVGKFQAKDKDGTFRIDYFGNVKALRTTQVIEMKRVEGNFQMSWSFLCPSCGKLDRCLYFHPFNEKQIFLCHKCHELSYLSKTSRIKQFTTRTLKATNVVRVFYLPLVNESVRIKFEEVHATLLQKLTNTIKLAPKDPNFNVFAEPHANFDSIFQPYPGEPKYMRRWY